MPTAYRSHTSATTGNASSGTTLAVTKPSGTVSGDLLVAIAWMGVNGAIGTLGVGSSGFTDSGVAYTAPNAGPKLKVFYKVAGSSEPASYTFGMDGAVSGTIELVCITGAATSQFDVTPVTNTATATTTPHTAASANAATAGDFLLTSWCAQVYSGGVQTQGVTNWTPQSGMTEVADIQSAYCRSCSAYQQLSATGATGTRTATYTIGNSATPDGNYAAVTILVKPANTTTTVSSTDTGAGTDSASVAASTAVAEVGTGSETAAIARTSTLGDAASGADTTSILRASNVADSGVGSETIAVTAVDFKTISDGGVGVDSIYVEIPALKDTSDVGTATDTATVAASTVLADGATGVDTVNIARSSVSSDTAAATDTVSLLRSSTPTDTATGSETLAVARTSAVDEQGTGTESIAIVRFSTVDDTGTGSDSVLPGPVVFDSGTGSEEITVVDIPFTQAQILREGPVYDLVVVARIPQVSGPPTFIQVDPIEWKSLTYRNTLSKSQELSASCLTAGVTEPILQRLRSLSRLATELWLYRNGRCVFAGPLLGWQTADETLTLQARGLLSYLQMMTVASDQRFAQVDQFTIAKTLVDQWQNLEYGNFGIDTSSVGASGKLRDGTYLASELHNVGTRVEELGQRQDGFDVEVDPGTRKLQLWYPTKGVDRSTGENAIVLDARNITSGDVLCSVAPGDLASEAFGTGTAAGADGTLLSVQSNLELRAQYGRTAVTASWSDVSEQATLDAHTSGLLDARGAALLVPGPNVRVTPDADLDAYRDGDSVAYELNTQLGVSGTFRIRSQTVKVASTGQESVDLEFV